MKNMCMITIVILLLVILGGAYKFLIQGSVSDSVDGRVAIHLTDAERAIVLKEMRTFLMSVQQIIRGISQEDMDHVAVSAREVGRAAQDVVPASLIGKLPLSFKKLGFDTHEKFDLIALDAKALGDPDHTMDQLTELMDNCVSCHESHRFVVEED